MPALKKCFDAMDFHDVTTVLASGNVLFTAPRPLTEATLEKRCDAALEKATGRAFMTFVRSVDDLEKMLDADPYAAFRLASDAKRVVTFMREPPRPRPKLPVSKDGARILALHGQEAFRAYVATPKGPVFMSLIETTFGQNVTTRNHQEPAAVGAAPDDAVLVAEARGQPSNGLRLAIDGHDRFAAAPGNRERDAIAIGQEGLGTPRNERAENRQRGEMAAPMKCTRRRDSSTRDVIGSPRRASPGLRKPRAPLR